MLESSGSDLKPEGQTAKKRVSGFDRTDILVFLIPCLQFIHINLVGMLSGSDILLLLTFVYLALRKKIRLNSGAAKVFVVFCLLWLASQCVTDVVRHSEFHDYARGWSNIGLTLVNFLVIFSLIYRRWQRILLFGWGVVAGQLLTYFISPNDYVADYPWKFGVAGPVTIGATLIASDRRCPRSLSLLFVISVGLINVFLGARSLGGICLIAAVYVVAAKSISSQRKGKKRIGTGPLLVGGAAMLLGVIGIYTMYQHAALSGWLGDDARTKFEQEANGAYGLLIGGRGEMLATIPAIIDSPILGHGSWAKDPIYTVIQHQALARLGYIAALEVAPDTLEVGLIPTHSYLFGAWVDGGILGAFFWFAVFIMALLSLFKVYPPQITLPPIMPWVAFSLLWNTFFSPFGATERVNVNFELVILISFLSIQASQAVSRNVKVAQGATDDLKGQRGAQISDPPPNPAVI